MGFQSSFRTCFSAFSASLRVRAFSFADLLRGFSQEAYAAIQCSMTCPEEVQKVAGVDHVVHHGWILAVGDVVNAEPRCPPVMMEGKFAFHRNVQGEIVRKTKRAW